MAGENDKIIAYGNRRSSKATNSLHPDDRRYFPAGLRLKNKCCADEILVMPKEGIFAVFDGISRLWDPPETARLARDTLEDMARHYDNTNIKEFMLNTSNMMHRNIRDAGYGIPVLTEGECERGTTYALGIIDENNFHIASAGNTRIYALYSDGNLRQLTEDDTLLEMGEYCLERYLGDKETETLDENYVSYKTISLQQNGVSIKKILFATDGITDTVSEADIKRILEEKNSYEAVEELIDAANNNPSEEKIREYADRKNKTFEEAKTKLPGKDDMAAVVIEPVYEAAAAEEENIRQENERLRNEIAGLKDRIRGYEAAESAAGEVEEPEPHVAVADSETELTLEAIANNAQTKKLELASRYNDYKIRRNHYENTVLVNVTDSVGFGEFLSREYEKVRKICADFENAEQELKLRFIGWCDKQLRRADNWARKVQNREPDYEEEVMSYKTSVENLRNHMTNVEITERGEGR